jgi:hypothetical protein
MTDIETLCLRLSRALNHQTVRYECLPPTGLMTYHADSSQQPRGLGYVRHQELHLVRQNAAVAQNEVFPQAGHIRRVQQRHVGLLGRAAAFAVVAGATGGHHIHPGINAILRKRNDVLTRQVFFVKVITAVGAEIAVAREQLAIGKPWLHIKRADIGHALGADDAVDRDDGLLAREDVMATVKRDNARPHLPAHFIGRVMQHGLFKADPRLWQSLG